LFDWKLVASTFFLIFLAELGDKTQLATLAFAAKSRSAWPIFAGAACALVATTAIATVLGAALSNRLPSGAIRIAAGLLFIIFGILTLLQRGDH